MIYTHACDHVIWALCGTMLVLLHRAALQGKCLGFLTQLATPCRALCHSGLGAGVYRVQGVAQGLFALSVLMMPCLC